MQLKDWVVVAGVGVIFLVAVLAAADALSDRTLELATTGKERLRGVHAGYCLGVLDLGCTLEFLDWRRRLVEFGLSELWSWVLAPLGLLLLILVSIVAWGSSYGDDSDLFSAWGAALVWVFYFAGIVGYATAAVGSWAAWFES